MTKKRKELLLLLEEDSEKQKYELTCKTFNYFRFHPVHA